MIRAAVIGTGYIGPIHIEALRRLPGVDVKIVCDVNRELARKAAFRYNIESVETDWRKIIGDSSIDVVHVCSNNLFHFEMNRAAILAGKHVMSEKPLAMTLEEAEELAGLAQKNGAVTGVNFCYRYYPAVIEAMMRLRSVAGVVRMASGSWYQDWLSKPSDWTWRLEKAQSGESNIAGDLGSHWFDLIQFVTGLKIAQVMADFSTIIPVRQKPKRQVIAFESSSAAECEDIRVELEEYAAIMFRLSNGAPGTFSTCQTVHGKKSEPEFLISADDCSLAWSHADPSKLWIGRRDKANEILIENPALMNNESSAYATLPAGHPLGYQDAVLNLFKDFYDDVKAGKTMTGRPVPCPTFETGAEEMRILKAIIESVKTRSWVEVKKGDRRQ
jgi:predicted dehydrogenase